MVEPITKKELELIEKRGGQIDTLARIIAVPALEKIARHFDEMKHEEMASYKAASEGKLAKMDQLIKVLEDKAIDLGSVVKIVSDIKAEHAGLIADFNAHKAHCDKEDDGPCAYRVTGQRDRRGFIDIEVGLLFTPVKDDG